MEPCLTRSERHFKNVQQGKDTKAEFKALSSTTQDYKTNKYWKAVATKRKRARVQRNTTQATRVTGGN